MKTFENNQVENWIQENYAAVTAEDKMVDDVRLFANEWEIVEQEKMAAEDDLHNPVYAGQSDRIKRLKKKKIWKFIAPLYRLYANVKVRIILICKTSKKEVIGSIVRKVKNKLLSKIMIKRRNKRFIAKITLSKEQLEEQRNTKFSKDVKFSIMVPLYNTPEQFLRDMIGSVQAQTYGNWELCRNMRRSAGSVRSMRQRIVVSYIASWRKTREFRRTPMSVSECQPEIISRCSIMMICYIRQHFSGACRKSKKTMRSLFTQTR